MVATLHVLSIILVAVGVGLALAHALELPGKRRLDEATFRAVQTIYYPGFTIGGVFGEPLAFLATAGLLALTPAERTPTRGHWLRLSCSCCLPMPSIGRSLIP